MFELNLSKNYFEHLLGYELFTSEIDKIKSKLEMEFNTPVELKIFYDIIAKVYLNALDHRKYEINLTPLFYLQLTDVRAQIGAFNTDNIQNLPDCPSAKYLSLRFADKMNLMNRRLDLLVNHICRYQKQNFKQEEEHKLIAFLDTMRMRIKPKWLMQFERNIPKVLVAEPLSTRILGPDIGQEIIVIRPYTVPFANQWDAQKTPVFCYRKKKIMDTLHFDMFLIRVIDRYITSDGVGILDAETTYDGHQFTGELIPANLKWSNVVNWRLSHKAKGAKKAIKEDISFYDICDLPRVNRIFGYPLSEYRLKTLMADIEFRLAALG